MNKKRSLFFLIVCLSTGLLGARATPAVAEMPATSTSILFYGPPDYLDTTLKEKLTKIGYQVGVVTASGFRAPLSWDVLKRFNVVVICAGGSLNDMLFEYVERGGGVLVLRRWDLGEGLKPLNRLGLDFAVGETIFERDSGKTHTLTVTPTHSITAAWTDNLSPHPITEGIQRIWYPIGLYYNVATIPIKVQNPSWHIVARGSKTAYSSPQYPENRCGVTVGAFATEPPIVVARQYKKGRIVVFPSISNVWADCAFHPVWDNGFFLRDEQTFQFMRNIYDWLAEPSRQSGEFGGFVEKEIMVDWAARGPVYAERVCTISAYPQEGVTTVFRSRLYAGQKWMKYQIAVTGKSFQVSGWKIPEWKTKEGEIQAAFRWDGNVVTFYPPQEGREKSIPLRDVKAAGIIFPGGSALVYYQMSRPASFRLLNYISLAGEYSYCSPVVNGEVKSGTTLDFYVQWLKHPALCLPLKDSVQVAKLLRNNYQKFLNPPIGVLGKLETRPSGSKIPIWWDEGFRYRMPIFISKPQGCKRLNYAGFPVEVLFDNRDLVKRVGKNSLRVVHLERSEWKEIPIQVETTEQGNFRVCFILESDIDITPSPAYYLYWDTSDKGKPDYRTGLEAMEVRRGGALWDWYAGERMRNGRFSVAIFDANIYSLRDEEEGLEFVRYRRSEHTPTHFVGLQNPPVTAHFRPYTRVPWHGKPYKFPLKAGIVPTRGRVYKGIIGVHSTYSGGKYTVKQFCDRAKSLGLNYLVFTEKLEMMDAQKWKDLARDCAMQTTPGFKAIPGLQFRSNGNLVGYNLREFIPERYLTEKPSNHLKDITVSIHKGLTFVLFTTRSNPWPPWENKFYQQMAVYTYKGAELIDEAVDIYLDRVSSRYIIPPSVVHLVDQPRELEEIVRREGIYFKYFIARNKSQFDLSKVDRLDTDPQFHFISNGPIIHRFYASNYQMWDKDNDRQRLWLDVSSDFPLKRVLLYAFNRGEELITPIRCFYPSGKRFLKTVEIALSQEGPILLWVEDTRGRNAFTGPIKLSCEDNNGTEMCSDLQDGGTSGIHYISGWEVNALVYPSVPARFLVPPGFDWPPGGVGIDAVPFIAVRGGSIGGFVPKWNLGFCSPDADMFNMRYFIVPRKDPGTGYLRDFTQPSQDLEARLRYTRFQATGNSYNMMILDHELEFKRDVEFDKNGWVKLVSLMPKTARHFAFLGADGLVHAGSIRKTISSRLGRWGFAAMFPNWGGAPAVFGLDAKDYSLRLGRGRMTIGLEMSEGVVPAGTIIKSKLLIVVTPGRELTPEPYVVLHDIYGFDGSPVYKVRLKHGKLEDSLYALTTEADDFYILGKVSKALLPNELGLIVKGLNGNWDAMLYDLDARRSERIGVFDNTGYATLDTSAERRIFVGHPFVCDNLSVVITVLTVGKGFAELEVHNPLEEDVAVRLRSQSAMEILPIVNAEINLRPGQTRRLIASNGLLIEAYCKKKVKTGSGEALLLEDLPGVLSVFVEACKENELLYSIFDPYGLDKVGTTYHHTIHSRRSVRKVLANGREVRFSGERGRTSYDVMGSGIVQVLFKD